MKLGSLCHQNMFAINLSNTFVTSCNTPMTTLCFLMRPQKPRKHPKFNYLWQDDHAWMLYYLMYFRKTCKQNISRKIKFVDPLSLMKGFHYLDHGYTDLVYTSQIYKTLLKLLDSKMCKEMSLTMFDERYSSKITFASWKYKVLINILGKSERLSHRCSLKLKDC